ncbi:hypothetical protein NLJ89_g6717 [Agrocybe chaxingu]|uniref:Uncharacterized protein n=1 Tax=Agrocybe chaxingu TaxID=84603 RepID=A0A9W8MVR5_9AGAR|nr:hypothetical protein NLJ89_g6717 [Agrocybe chaxingu]
MILESAWNGPQVDMTVTSRPQDIFGFIQICEYYDHERQEWHELLATPLEIGVSPVLASLRRVLQTALDCFLPSLDINIGGSFGDDQEGMLTINSPHEPLLNSTVHVISDSQLDNWESLPLLQSISSEQTCCLFIVTERRACQVFVDKPSGNFCLGPFVHIHTSPREFIGLFALFILSSSCWDCSGQQGHQCKRQANLFNKMLVGDRQELFLTFLDALQESKGLEILPKEVTLAPIIHQPIPVPVLPGFVPWIDQLDEMRQEGCSPKREPVESPDSYPPDSAMGDSYEAFVN